MEFLEQLNPEQRKAVEHTEGPLLILAGAGSGKTRVITVRIAYLIAEKQVQPFNILAVTFTNKASGEMRERVRELLKGQKLQSAPLISTFHSLCVRILRQDIEALEEGYSRSFTIYDTDDSQKVIKACIRDIGMDPKELSPRMVRNAISSAKNNGEDVELFASRVDYADERRASIARVFRMYEERLNKANALDFDDLMIKTVRLLRMSPQIREKYNNKFRYILVDEYQDINALQFALIQHLTETSQNICVVGDDAQSIYAFRGADIGNILSFEEYFPRARSILLEQNYRSTQTILDVADAIISNNQLRKEKKLWTDKAEGSKIRYFQAFDADNEAKFVASKIYDHQRANRGDRIAVLYRTNAQSRVFEDALRRMRIDYNIVGGFSFYERAEIRDVVAYLKLALNPSDDIALLRVINTPARGLGKASLDELEALAKDLGAPLWETIAAVTDEGCERPVNLTQRAKESLKKLRTLIESLSERTCGEAAGDKPVSEIVIAAIEDTGYANMLRAENSDEANARLENLEELVNAAVDYDDQGADGLRNFIDHAALSSDTDKYDRNARVTLMTVHSAKGLEFPVVFIVGLEDGIFPHARSINDPNELEEERRLAYVAVTRAEKYLYLTHSMRRRVYGAEMSAEPSQFLNEVPLDLIEDLSSGNSWLSFARSAAANSESLARPSVSTIEQPKARSTYQGKTYDSAEAIAEFFRNRKGTAARSADKPPEQPKREIRPPSEQNYDIEKGGNNFLPGAQVRHAKYGRGLVLRREGSGDNTKLTVSFPGFGQKKLMEKFAGLEPA